MDNIEVLLNGDELLLKISGRVDSANSVEIEKSLTEAIANNSHKTLVLDVENLEYISSAGLRIILRVRKNESAFEIINANSEVYEIFDMTGFTEMMTVKKAYKKISVDGCEIIGEGATGKVYRFDPETIVKCYYKKDALNEINRERELARKAFVLGIPTAISYDVVRVGDGYGSVFELLNADTLLKLIINDPENIDKYIADEVDVLKKFHLTEVNPKDVPSVREKGIGWVKEIYNLLPESTAEKLLGLFENIKDSNTLLHGDFHIKNVMIQNGEVLLIDMDTLCRGDAVYEFAAMYNAYIAYSDLDKNNSMEFFGVPYETTEYLFNKTLEMYLGTDDKTALTQAYNKAALVGYTEMLKCFNADNESEEAIEHYKNKLIELVDIVDSVSFN